MRRLPEIVFRLGAPAMPAARRLVIAGRAHLRQNLRDALRDTPRAVCRPAVLLQWLVRSHWAQAALVLAIVVMPRWVPAATDAVLDELYPPVVTKKLLGLVQWPERDPRLEARRKQVRGVLWSGSGGLVVLLYWLSLPRVVRRCSALARQKEQQADALVHSQPAEARALYRAAGALSVDPEQTASLEEKLTSLDGQVPPHLGSREVPPATVGEAPAGRTVLLEPGPAQGLGEIAGRYRLEEEIGRGSMGVVYRAHDRVLERRVALKELPGHLAHDHRLAQRLQQEARALARLNHPNIVQVYDFLNQDGRGWIAMEWVEGGDLEGHLSTGDGVDLRTGISLAIPMAEALAYAHRRGVLHRDFKPVNVLLSTDLGPKVSDFGLAKLAHSSVQTYVGAVLGSPAYMSPEQVSGREADQRSDIYALGATLYRLFTGRRPFEGDTASVLAQHLTQPPVPPRDVNPALPAELDRLLLTLLAKDPGQRPSTMEDVVAALRGLSPN